MKIVCPYTRLHPETEAVMREVAAELVDVSASDYAYWDLIVRRWGQRKPFILVEHDLVPTPEQLRALAACPRPLCVHEYCHHGSRLWSLGCTKFGRRALAHQLTSEIRTSVLNFGPPAPPWQDVCSHLLTQLINSGLDVHVHQGLVRHAGHDCSDDLVAG